MVDKSINGWVVIPTQTDARLAVGVVPGTKIKLRARNEVLPLLLAIAADYHKEVAPLRAGECGAYAFRKALQGGGLYSDHSSGTAVDLNWGHEGAMGANGGMKTMTDAQIKACATIKKRYKIIIWGGDAAKGGDYTNSKSWDPMHFALKPNTKVGDVAKIRAALGINKNGVRIGAGIKAPSIITKLIARVKPVVKPLNN